MAIVTYKCDVCARTKEIKRNPTGLETTKRCSITHGCRGNLYQINVLDDFQRGRLPDRVTGLEDWRQRRVVFDFEQGVEKDRWEIQHNLGVPPSVFVLVNRQLQNDLDNQEEITPNDIIYTDNNNVVLVFDRPWAGIAQLVAKETDPLLFNPSVTVVEEVPPTLQASKNGSLTIATKASISQEVNININIKYTTNSSDLIYNTYTVDDQPSTNSPWVDFNKVIIKGNVYIVRSFNAIIDEMATGTITSGSFFKFEEIDTTGGSPIVYRPLVSEEVLLLLADEPYATVDKITNKYVDVSQVTDTLNPFALFYSNSEFFVTPEVVITTFPTIREV